MAMTMISDPTTAQQVSTAIAVLAPAPSKNAVERSRLALAPWGRNWPRVPQPLGSNSGALVNPDSGFPTSKARSAPHTNPTRPNSSLRPRINRPAAIAPSVSPPATAQKFWSIEPSTYRITAVIVTPASAEKAAVAAILIRTSRRTTSVSATTGRNPASVIGSAAAANPVPRGSPDGGG